MANMEAKRYRFQVPSEDVTVQEWLAAQINVSTSLRQLIREDIQRNGFTDVTCRAVEQGAKRGRPTNAELARRAEALEEREENNITEPVQTVQTVIEKPKVDVQTPQQTRSVLDATPKNPGVDALMDLLG